MIPPSVYSSLQVNNLNEIKATQIYPHKSEHQVLNIVNDNTQIDIDVLSEEEIAEDNEDTASIIGIAP